MIVKSTVPAITGRWIKKTVARYARMLPSANGDGGARAFSAATPLFDVACNPEFLQEGKAIENFFHPDRIVCGVESERARQILTELYKPLGVPILFCDISTAELIKHAANAFLATKISFINIVSDLAEVVGADVTKVAAGIGADPRIGSSFLNAGIGFGGYCLPKDLRAFIRSAEQNNIDFSLLRSVEKINQRRSECFLRKVRQALWVLNGKTIGVLGLAFKAGTDDMREAPSLRIIDALLRGGATLQLYDPAAMQNARKLFPETDRLRYCQNPYAAASGAHALLILTEWDEFRNLDLLQVRTVMEVPVLVDGRNLYDPVQVTNAGFEYMGMGRMTPAIVPDSDNCGQNVAFFSEPAASEPLTRSR
jgi:UDPglucose 6-dehydrogenase